MNNILSMVKGKISDVIGSQSGIPEEKKDVAVDAATSSAVDALKSSLGGGGLSQILGGGGVSGIESKVETAISTALTSKAHLSPEVASSVSNKAVSAVMKMLTSEGGGKGLDLGSLANTLKGL